MKDKRNQSLWGLKKNLQDPIKELNHTWTGDSNPGKAHKLLISLNPVHQPWLIFIDLSDLCSDCNWTKTQSHSSLLPVLGYMYMGVVHLCAPASTGLVLLWQATASNVGHFYVDGNLIQVVHSSVIAPIVPAASLQTMTSTILKLDNSWTCV